ncbi:hypothetical protein DdX_17122 [Ditylenchus destructor]|uniref:F-box domain-containing protein n=1 Tax=Ditylenchus destructor TaxID=166010 RepID=A0AAD4QZA1_9BILA|nr:hypothetical protein DdX_17122 [Ditylenchus destructor]
MFKRKKNVAVVFQKQKFAISLPSDVWSEILRYFSRKQLCRQVQLVNHQLYDLASSRHNVPTTHVINTILFPRAKRPLSFLNIFKSRRYKCVRIPSSITLETNQLQKKPIPEFYVHFRKVYIYRLLEESTLQFLRDAKESFTGSAIHYDLIDILYNKDMRNQMHYLLQNVFQKPSHIYMSWSCCPFSDLKVLTDGLQTCSRIKLEFWHDDIIPDKDIIRMLLDWLSSGRSLAHMDSIEKHVILNHFPRCLILNIVQQIKDAFKYKNLLLSDFVITFVESQEGPLCLEGNHTFVLNRIASNERLSFFTHNEFPGSHSDSGRAYRLWHSSVVNEAEDQKMAIHLQNLKEWSGLGIDLRDFEFYDFSYPYTSE